MKDLKGKKLLVLGGNALSCDIVRAAQEMGIYVIVTDWNDIKDSPAKLIADEAWQISLSNTSELAEKIKAQNIEGVITGFTDSYLHYYYDICVATGLPCYGTPHQFGIATDKLLFKEACKKSSVGIVPGDCVTTLQEAESLINKIGYPLIFKPVDNSGSRGVIRCDDNEHVKDAFEYAMSFSPSKHVICEKFMDCDCVGISYQLNDDKAKLAMLGDKKIFPLVKSFSTSPGSIYPSKYLARFLKEVDPYLKNFLKNEGFKNGIASFDAFVDDDGFYLTEMCYRLSGGQHYVMVDDAYGVNGLKLLIEFALTGKISDFNEEVLSPNYKELYVRINLPGKPNAKIAKIEGLERLRNASNVIKVIQKHYEKENIGANGTSAQMLFSIFLKCKDKNEIKNFIDSLNATLIVQDKDGNSLIEYDGLEALYTDN